MKVEERIVNRFQQLIDFENDLMKTRRIGSGDSYVLSLPYDQVDDEMVFQWGTSCLGLIKQTFSSDSDHYINLKELFPKLSSYSDGTQTVKKTLTKP